MRLLILGSVTSPYDSPIYRGTDRPGPHYVDSYDDAHVVNQLFLEYAQRVGDGGYIEDPDFARQLVDTYASIAPPQVFEIVEGTRADERPKVGELFLGYDLSYKFYLSLLTGGFRPVDEPISLPDDHPFQQVAPRVRMLMEQFRPLLNEFGLFPDEAMAFACLEQMIAIQADAPNLWDADSALRNYEASGLWLVR